MYEGTTESSMFNSSAAYRVPACIWDPFYLLSHQEFPTDGNLDPIENKPLLRAQSL